MDLCYQHHQILIRLRCFTQLILTLPILQRYPLHYIIHVWRSMQIPQRTFLSYSLSPSPFQIDIFVRKVFLMTANGRQSEKREFSFIFSKKYRVVLSYRSFPCLKFSTELRQISDSLSLHLKMPLFLLQIHIAAFFSTWKDSQEKCWPFTSLFLDSNWPA